MFNSNFESVFIEISHSQESLSIDKDTVVGVIYRPPGINVEEFSLILSDI